MLFWKIRCDGYVIGTKQGIKSTMGGLLSIVRLIALSQFMPKFMKHYLQYFWGLIKNWKVTNKRKSPPLPQPTEHYTESGLGIKSYFLELCRYISMTHSIN